MTASWGAKGGRATLIAERDIDVIGPIQFLLLRCHPISRIANTSVSIGIIIIIIIIF